MSTAFDQELNRVNDTEMDYGEENYDDGYMMPDTSDGRTYGERPSHTSKPRQINIQSLARNDNSPAFGRSARSPVPTNLTNRVPGITEMLEADSEVLHDLSRKRTTNFNPKFLEQNKGLRDRRDVRLDEDRDHLYDKVERERRREEREKLREERHRREMQQRSRFHKHQAKTGEQMQTTLQSHNEAMVARTNQLGTLIEEVRSDLLEAQIEAQNANKKIVKAMAARDEKLNCQLSWLMVLTCATLTLLTVAFICRYIWPTIRRKWRGKSTNAQSAAEDKTDKSPQSSADDRNKQAETLNLRLPVATNADSGNAVDTGETGKNSSATTPTALDTSEDLSIGI